MKINFKKDVIFIGLLSLAMIIITTTPYLWNYFTRPANTEYTWIGIYNPVDMPVYYSYIEQARQGRYTFIDLLTGEIQTQRFFNIFWLSVGLMARGLNITPPIAFHLARILLIPLFVWTLKKTIDFFYPTKRWRPLLLASLFISGLGALYYLISNNFTPVDIEAAEATPFASMFFTGHFILSWTLLLWSIMLTIKCFQRQSLKNAFGAGFINLLFFQFHPYYTPLIFLFTIAALVYNLIISPRIKILLLALPPLLLPMPSILYYAYLWLNDQRFYVFSLNKIQSPSWWITFLSFGLLGPLAIAGIATLLRGKQWKEIHTYLFFWLSTAWILLYFPFTTQRRFVEGLIVPMGFFALAALEKFKNRMTWKPERYPPKTGARLAAGWLFIIFFCFSSVFIYITNFEFKEQIYLSQKSMASIEWMKQNSNGADIFLSPDGKTNIIAALSGRQFYGWHWSETTFAIIKYKMLKSFFANAADPAREKFLRQNKITKLYWDNEYGSQYSFRPEEKNYLKKIYDNGDVKIYAVN